MDVRAHLLHGHVIPALPLALTPNRRWDERHQRALVRYYVAAGVGGLAVGVHSTQFAIRDPQIGLFEPVLSLAATTAREPLSSGSPPSTPFALIAGLCGQTPQAVREAQLARRLGYHAGLLSLGAYRGESEAVILRHCRRVARELPLVGFYLQPAVGGRVLSYSFWRAFAEIPEVVAIKMAPFNRYRTIDVVRAVLDADRDDVALYTGNDDNIIVDLLTPFQFGGKTRHIVGGLLGQWGVWTSAAVRLLEEIRVARASPDWAARSPAGSSSHRRPAPPSAAQPSPPADWLQRNAALTDANAAIFDAAHDFAGCLPGIHEVLRRQGLLATTHCLDPHERLSPRQAAEITRVTKAYPWLTDDAFVAANLRRWLA